MSTPDEIRAEARRIARLGRRKWTYLSNIAMASAASLAQYGKSESVRLAACRLLIAPGAVADTRRRMAAPDASANPGVLDEFEQTLQAILENVDGSEREQLIALLRATETKPN